VLAAKLTWMAVSTRRNPRWPAGPTLLTAVLAVVLSALAGVMIVKLGTVQRELKAILIMVALLAMAVAALRPQIGLAMFLVLMPFEFQFSGTGTDEVLIVAMAIVLAWRIEWRVVPAWISSGGVLLVLGSFAAAIAAHDQSTALWGAVRWLGVITVMFAGFTVLRDRRDASRRMVDIFTGSAVVVVAFAFAQKAGIYTLVGAPYQHGLPDSFFGFYTVYAGYVAMAATLATGEILIALDGGRKSRAALYTVALLLMLVGVAISTSRGGLLALGAGWLLLLIFNFRRGPVFIRAVLLLVILAGAAYVVTPQSAVTKYEQRLTVAQGTLNGDDRTRFALHEIGERALSEHPFGIGYGNFPFYLNAHVRSGTVTTAFFHAHETPVQVGLDAGWLGLIGFLMLWGYPIVLVLARGGGGSSVVRASAFAAALGGFMAQGLYDYLFYEIAFLAFFVALVWGSIHALSVEAAPSSI
jgi:hypothetical protein